MIFFITTYSIQGIGLLANVLRANIKEAHACCRKNAIDNKSLERIRKQKKEHLLQIIAGEYPEATTHPDAYADCIIRVCAARD
ncbi:hypothetical protein [Aeromonas enteropelogenes]|uniref:hypothetical protein n=1 Tax=Aeromonas enteropelogenes TaxID=29489 RepID=UPI003987F682